MEARQNLELKISSLIEIIFLISGRTIKFFHLLGEEKQKLCFKTVDMIAESTNKQTDGSVQPTGKSIELISQSERALH